MHQACRLETCLPSEDVVHKEDVIHKDHVVHKDCVVHKNQMEDMDQVVHMNGVVLHVLRTAACQVARNPVVVRTLHDTVVQSSQACHKEHSCSQTN